jgi:hypothetical protein
MRFTFQHAITGLHNHRTRITNKAQLLEVPGIGPLIATRLDVELSNAHARTMAGPRVVPRGAAILDSDDDDIGEAESVLRNGMGRRFQLEGNRGASAAPRGRGQGAGRGAAASMRSRGAAVDDRDNDCDAYGLGAIATSRVGRGNGRGRGRGRSAATVTRAPAGETEGWGMGIDCGNEDEAGRSSGLRHAGGKAPREYRPRYRTGAYAILVALWKHYEDGDESDGSRDYMERADLIDTAQKYASEPMDPKIGGKGGTTAGYYAGWSSMNPILIKKNLVDKRGTRSKYYLTETGRELARKLADEHDAIEARTVHTYDPNPEAGCAASEQRVHFNMAGAATAARAVVEPRMRNVARKCGYDQALEGGGEWGNYPTAPPLVPAEESELRTSASRRPAGLTKRNEKCNIVRTKRERELASDVVRFLMDEGYDPTIIRVMVTEIVEGPDTFPTDCNAFCDVLRSRLPLPDTRDDGGRHPGGNLSCADALASVAVRGQAQATNVVDGINADLDSDEDLHAVAEGSKKKRRRTGHHLADSAALPSAHPLSSDWRAAQKASKHAAEVVHELVCEGSDVIDCFMAVDIVFRPGAELPRSQALLRKRLDETIPLNRYPLLAAPKSTETFNDIEATRVCSVCGNAVPMTTAKLHRMRCGITPRDRPRRDALRLSEINCTNVAILTAAADRNQYPHEANEIVLDDSKLDSMESNQSNTDDDEYVPVFADVLPSPMAQVSATGASLPPTAAAATARAEAAEVQLRAAQKAMADAAWESEDAKRGMEDAKRAAERTAPRVRILGSN